MTAITDFLNQAKECVDKANDEGFRYGTAVELQAYVPRLIEIVEVLMKACADYDQAFDDTGTDYGHLVMLCSAYKLIEKANEIAKGEK